MTLTCAMTCFIHDAPADPLMTPRLIPSKSNTSSAPASFSASSSTIASRSPKSYGRSPFSSRPSLSSRNSSCCRGLARRRQLPLIIWLPSERIGRCTFQIGSIGTFGLPIPHFPPFSAPSFSLSLETSRSSVCSIDILPRARLIQLLSSPALSKPACTSTSSTSISRSTYRPFLVLHSAAHLIARSSLF